MALPSRQNPVNYLLGRQLGFLFWRALFFLFFLPVPIPAEQRPLKIYTTADGLAHDQVGKIVQDSRGFLWFCTGDGLSRFDGYRFKNYTQEHGLPHRRVNDFLEARDGTFYLSTSGGIAIFNPYGKPYRWNVVEGKPEQNSTEPPLFQIVLPAEVSSSRAWRAVYSMAQSAQGELFAATNHGLFKLVGEGEQRHLELVENRNFENNQMSIGDLLTDSKGGLWLISETGLYWMSPAGNFERLHEIGGSSIFADREGRIWVQSGGADLGIRLYEYRDEKPVLTRIFNREDGLAINTFSNAVAQSAEGRIYVSSNGILHEFIPEAPAHEPKFRAVAGGLIANGLTDRDGNIWLSSLQSGVWRFSPNGFVSYGKEVGLSDEAIASMFLNREGEVFTVNQSNKINRLTPTGMESIVPRNFPGRSWGETFLDFQDRYGEWWIPGKDGLYHYPAVKNFADLAHTPPLYIYTTRDGLFANEVFNIFEGSDDTIWISAVGPGGTLQKLDRRSNRIIQYPQVDYAKLKSGAVTDFAEDKAGNLWFSFLFGGLMRFRNGEFQSFTAKDGMPESGVSDFLTDRQGRLWIATVGRGLFRVDEPNADSPNFVNFSTSHGLSSNEAKCLAQDKFGRIYVGTARGLNRLDGENFNVRVFAQAEGLPGSFISQCRTDRNGVLWIASINSLARFVPTIEKPSPAPPILIDRILVNGVLENISELGESAVQNIELNPDQRQIQIDFFALGLTAGETLRYQYKLNEQDWSIPSDQRSVSFNLSAGNYNFTVRAINSGGMVSENPATFSFRISPPIWQRWWFLTLSVLFLGVSIFALDRFRVRKTRQVESALVQSKESETRFRTLAETASDAILTIDEDSRIIFVNQAVEKVFGYSQPELIGQKLTMLMPERMRAGHNQGITRYLTTSQKNMSWEGVALPGLHKDGHEIPLEVSFGEFERKGKRYFTGIARDVSERQRAERALAEAREEKFRELQRVRTRIARDLHDDIGSSLTQIAVLSEVARKNVLDEQVPPVQPLESISTVSNELVEAMSDIVWAINPRKDTLRELVLRMRRFASDILTAREIEFELTAPETDGDFQLGANIRREVFAIFKECINNIVRHAGAKNVEIVFHIVNREISVKISDDGHGFDTATVLSEDFSPDKGGNGLINLRRRTRDLGGNCEITSTCNGTIIYFKIPVAAPFESSRTTIHTDSET